MMIPLTVESDSRIGLSSLLDVVPAVEADAFSDFLAGFLQIGLL
jgi:hypothetical protein